MARKRRKQSDPFGINRINKNMTLDLNRTMGRLGEISFQAEQEMQGTETRKIKKGADFVVQRRNIWTGRKIGKPLYVETKTGNARLSKHQKRMQKKKGRQYRVVRY